MKKIVAAVMMSAAVAAPAFAADAPAAANSGFYLGANLGMSHSSNVYEQKPSKANGGLFSLLGGYQYNKHFAAEIQYAYLGKAEFNTFTAGTTSTTKAHNFSLNGIGILPVSESFGLYGKFGVGFTTSSVSNFPAATGYGGKTRFDTNVGLGVQYDIAQSFAMRAGWDRYNAALKTSTPPSADIYNKNTWSVGGLYRF